MALPTAADVMKMVTDNEVKFVDFRFTDTRGKEQHVSVPVTAFGADKFESGHFFDGSSIAGWKGIQASDMILMPDRDYRLAADGDDVYRNFIIDPHFTQDMYVRAVEVRPGNRAVVHHVLNYIDGGHWMAAADLDEDGRLDVAVGSAGDPLSVLLNTSE